MILIGKWKFLKVPNDYICPAVSFIEKIITYYRLEFLSEFVYRFKTENLVRFLQDIQDFFVNWDNKVIQFN